MCEAFEYDILRFWRDLLLNIFELYFPQAFKSFRTKRKQFFPYDFKKTKTEKKTIYLPINQLNVQKHMLWILMFNQSMFSRLSTLNSNLCLQDRFNAAF